MVAKRLAEKKSEAVAGIESANAVITAANSKKIKTVFTLFFTI